jgi:hypothetical protein
VGGRGGGLARGHGLEPEVGGHAVGCADRVVLGEQPHRDTGGSLVGEEPPEAFEHHAQAPVGDLIGRPPHARGVVAQRRAQEMRRSCGHHRHYRLAAVQSLEYVGHRTGAQALRGVI